MGTRGRAKCIYGWSGRSLEQRRKGGKIGPTAVGEPVDTEGREAEGKPVLLEEGPLVAARVTVGNVGEELAGAEKFTDFWR